jgi:hypothetical protein
MKAMVRVTLRQLGKAKEVISHETEIGSKDKTTFKKRRKSERTHGRGKVTTTTGAVGYEEDPESVAAGMQDTTSSSSKKGNDNDEISVSDLSGQSSAPAQRGERAKKAKQPVPKTMKRIIKSPSSGGTRKFGMFTPVAFPRLEIEEDSEVDRWMQT